MLLFASLSGRCGYREPVSFLGGGFFVLMSIFVNRYTLGDYYLNLDEDEGE